MNTNIEISNINKHFFIRINNSLEKRKNITKIYPLNFISMNEVEICEKISKIPYYENNFNIIIDYDFIKFGQLNEKMVESIQTFDNNEKLVLFQYKNEKCIEFNIFLLNLHTPKSFIFHVLESFSYLLNSLIILNSKNICFFNLTDENIVFNLDCGEKPILQNFSKSIQLSKINEIYISKIINSIDNYTYKPLEVHILFYLIKNDLDTISLPFIEEISEHFVRNLDILRLFSQNYVETFKISCINSLKKYINKPKIDIIYNIIERTNTWDNYSISILYLHIIGNICRVFSLKETFMNKWLDKLLKNIHPDPLKRETMTQTKQEFNSLYNEFTDWSYINTIPLEKLKTLLENLSNK
jgi:hypothetical protein